MTMGEKTRHIYFLMSSLIRKHEKIVKTVMKERISTLKLTIIREKAKMSFSMVRKK